VSLRNARKKSANALSEKSVCGYARCSTDEQSREGVTLQSQEMRIRAFCVASGRIEPQMVIDDGQSAKTLNRPGLQRILEAVMRGEVGTLVVLKLDRLTRSVGDLATLLALFERHGCALVAVQESLDTSTASGRLMLNLLASVSQWEREAISERTAAAFEYKRQAREVYCKGAPFGFRRENGRLVEVPAQIAAIREMKRMAAEGLSLRKIAAHLTRRGISPSGGGQWFAQSVKVVLTSQMTATLPLD
jgi:DNA invertase Pin-like site-specific DNA recombinase